MSLEGYNLVTGDYIREKTLVEVKQFEKHLLLIYFFSTGFTLNRVKEDSNRTMDYQYEDIGFEVTVIHPYLPKNNELHNLLSCHNQINSKMCAYMYR